MSFSTPLTLIVRAKLEGGKVHFLDELKAVVKYHHVDELFRRQDEKRRSEAEQADHDAALCQDEAHSFEIKSIRRVDGATSAQEEAGLVRGPWSMADGGTLDHDTPKGHFRKRAEKRQATLSFNAKQFSLDVPAPLRGESLAMYEALIEGGTIRFEIVVDGRVTIPLIVKLVVFYQ